ncbi:MAG: hypothetical protein ACTHNN_12755 [Xanthobacteraceae bacterium]
MSRPRQRVCLQDGLKLDLNRLIRDRLIRRDAFVSNFIRWSHSYWGEVATGSVAADLIGWRHGWLEVEIGGRCQRMNLIASPRPFDGRQWYFICPVTGRRASVVWRPPGADHFRSRQGWGLRSVAYASQFNDATGRAHMGQARIKSRLIGGNDPDEWDLPPKPKWMRWRTYNRLESQFDCYEAVLNDGLLALVARFEN